MLFPLLAFGIILIPLIIIHEFGHLLACKSVGIAVLEFGLGFPPRAAKLFRWGETDFTLNWIPLGGFVMPYGEDFVRPLTEQEMEEARKSNETFQNKSLENAKSVYQAKPWEKAWFLFAGPLANLVAAFVIFGVIALTGVLMVVADVTVAGVEEGGIAEQAGLRQGDIITHVNGEPIDQTSNEEVLFDISPDLYDLMSGQTEVTLTVERDGETQEIVLDPEGVISGTTRVGIAELQEDSPALEAGFEPEDVVLAVNGDPITSIAELSEVTSDHDGKEMIVTVLRDGETLDIPVTPQRLNDESRARIGIVLEPTAPVEFEDLGLTVRNTNFEQITRHYSIFNSFKYGAEQFARAVDLMASMPGQLIRGEISAEEARPVSVVAVSQIGGEIIENNPYQDVLMFTALISIALAITNLLPIPGLDGGRLLFVLIEVIRGRPMSPEREGVVHLIGIGILLSLMVVLVINDLLNPVTF